MTAATEEQLRRFGEKTRQRWLERSNIHPRLLRQPLDVSDVRDAQGRSRGALVTGWKAKTLEGATIGREAPLGGLGLLVYGEPGEGKTHLVSTLMGAILREVPVVGATIWPRPVLSTFRPVYFSRYTALLDLQKRLFTRDEVEDPDVRNIIDGLTGAAPDWTISILVIDDLGKEHATSWNESWIEGLTRTRYELGLPTIITTNVLLKDWGKTYGQSAASFAHEAFTPIEMIGGGDRRRYSR